MTFQIYAHIAYTLIMVIGGGYLGYKYGAKAYQKAYNIEQAAKVVK